MNRQRLEELQKWLPPPKFCKKKYGEYTKMEALTILSTVLSDRWGNRFNCSTLRYEKELADITRTLEGLTDDNVYMKQSIVPQIINSLTPFDHDAWFNHYEFEGSVSLPSGLVIEFIQVMANLHNQDIYVIENELHFEMIDTSGEPLAYQMELPIWMLVLYYSDNFYSEILYNLTNFGSIFSE